MKHLILPILDASFEGAVRELAEVQRYLGEAACAALGTMPAYSERWGYEAKRHMVAFTPSRPKLIGKSEERLSEIVNILATIEHLIAALSWFHVEPRFVHGRVRECHPSTSDTKASDLIIAVSEVPRAWCEVTDVIARRAGQNQKEIKTLKNLHVTPEFLMPEISRFWATSRDFAEALCSTKRRWAGRSFQYVRHDVRGHGNTSIVEILPHSQLL